MDFDSGSGFSDFFEALFGRSGMSSASTTGRTGQETFRRRVGDNIEQPVEVTLQEAYLGGSRTFNIQSTEICPTCRGTGEVGNRTCVNCGGQGMVTRTKRLQVKIPAGVDNGSKIRVAGEGQPGLGGGPRGDLYLVISVKPDAQFERKGDDLYVDIEVDLISAMLGGEVPVPLPDGRKLVLTIPPETQNGRLFRLSGKGMPRLRGEGTGTLFARVKVVLPMHLTGEERGLFEQLARYRGSGAEIPS
jgi:DnaJ-class molecular chaperone